MPAMHAVTAQMRRAGRSLLSTIIRLRTARYGGQVGIARASGAIAGRLLVGVFGRWKWDTPGWLAWMDRRTRTGWRFVTANPKRASAAAALLVAAGAGYAWYASRPTPHYVAYRVHSPALTTYDDRGIPRIDWMAIAFSESAAPLKDLEKAVTAGVEISPAVAGTWFWTTDKELRFTPANDWPVNGEFSVRIVKRGLLADRVRLADYRFTFKSAPFSARISESQFYSGSPVNPNLKKLVATVKFSHPVDTAQLELRISLRGRERRRGLGLTPDSRATTVAYDKLKLSRSSTGGLEHAARRHADDGGRRQGRARGPRRQRYQRPAHRQRDRSGAHHFRFADARMTVVDNARYEPEQILLIGSSSPVAERAFADKVSVQLLPERHPRQPAADRRPYQWRDISEIGHEILADSPSVSASYVASDEGGNTAHGFKFLAPVDRWVYVMVKEGVAGTGGYLSGKPFLATVKVEPYRQALTFLGQGALLSLSGDRKVGFLVRDVDEVEIQIGRVLPNQLHHLAADMRDFSQPSLYDGAEDRLVERFTTTRDYRGRPPGKPIYDSIDLGQHLDANGVSLRGLFLLHVGSTTNSRGDSVADTRLILVTDLGVIVKQAKDGSRDVFVQSIRSGAPVAGARIEIVGVNGQPAQASTTDVNGHARLPKSDELVREKRPLLISAATDGDLSFLPINSRGRELDLSRFDTGGVESGRTPQQLSAYLFSDRGIYRPGETVHLGVITRSADWEASLTGLPIDIEVSDSRGLLISRSQVKLSAASFDEAHTTQPSAPTGTTRRWPMSHATSIIATPRQHLVQGAGVPSRTASKYSSSCRSGRSTAGSRQTK